jgi:hypothetical protein
MVFLTLLWLDIFAIDAFTGLGTLNSTIVALAILF